MLKQPGWKHVAKFFLALRPFGPGELYRPLAKDFPSVLKGRIQPLSVRIPKTGGGVRITAGYRVRRKGFPVTVYANATVVINKDNTVEVTEQVLCRQTGQLGQGCKPPPLRRKN